MQFRSISEPVSEQYRIFFALFEVAPVLSIGRSHANVVMPRSFVTLSFLFSFLSSAGAIPLRFQNIIPPLNQCLCDIRLSSLCLR